MRAGGIHNTYTGTVTGAGAAVTIVLGFIPAQVVVYNETDATRWEKLYDQVDANSIKTVTAGTQTTDTGSAIIIGNDTNGVAKGSIKLSSTVAANGKALVVRASL